MSTKQKAEIIAWKTANLAYRMGIPVTVNTEKVIETMDPAMIDYIWRKIYNE